MIEEWMLAAAIAALGFLVGCLSRTLPPTKGVALVLIMWITGVCFFMLGTLGK